MTQVLFTKTAAGGNFGPYLPGDVVDINAGDLAKMTGPTDPNGTGAAAAIQLASTHPLYNHLTKRGT